MLCICYVRNHLHVPWCQVCYCGMVVKPLLAPEILQLFNNTTIFYYICRQGVIKGIYSCNLCFCLTFFHLIEFSPNNNIVSNTAYLTIIFM
jgi:hypothetical protein